MARQTSSQKGLRSSVPRPRGDGPRAVKRDSFGDERSPPARGWPGDRGAAVRRRRAFPARAGMARRPVGRSKATFGVPRPRGDGPMTAVLRSTMRMRSPPARGWPVEAHAGADIPPAFPARAGMARCDSGHGTLRRRVPRPRGDGPLIAALCAGAAARSPPARGWPGREEAAEAARIAFPARAGMARPSHGEPADRPGVPRPRGDGP